MSEKIRRTFEFTAEHKAALDAIKRDLGVKTDTAALNYAVKLAAHLSTRKTDEVDQALWLRDELDRRMKDGSTLVIEKVGPHGALAARAELLLPPLVSKGGDPLAPPQPTMPVTQSDDQVTTPSRPQSASTPEYEDLKAA